jgi:hypothetical protein
MGESIGFGITSAEINATLIELKDCHHVKIWNGFG